MISLRVRKFFFRVLLFSFCAMGLLIVFNATITNFFPYVNTARIFSLFDEIVMHDIHGENLEQEAGEYIKFEVHGWTHMFNL